MASSDELYHLGVPAHRVPARVVLAEPELADVEWPASWRRTVLGRRREFSSFLLDDGEVEVLVCVGGVGSPAAVIALEELLRAGASTALGLTTCRCGACDRADAGHGPGIVVGAVRHEGTSADYAPPQYPAVPDARLVLALLAAAPAAAPVVVRTVDVLDEWRTPPTRASQGPVDLCSSALLVAGAAAGARVGTVILPGVGSPEHRTALAVVAALAAFPVPGPG